MSAARCVSYPIGRPVVVLTADGQVVRGWEPVEGYQPAANEVVHEGRELTEAEAAAVLAKAERARCGRPAACDFPECRVGLRCGRRTS